MEDPLFKKIQALPLMSQEVPVNFRRFLAYPDSVWFIESGEGAVFAMERTGNLVENGVLDKGPLNFLSQVKTGSLLFGFNVKPEDSIAILVITHSKTKFKKVAIEKLAALIAEEPAVAKYLAHQLNAWVNQFARQVAYFAIDTEDYQLEASKTLEVEASEIISPFHSIDPKLKEDVIWVEVVEGEAFLFGYDQMIINKETGPFPLNQISWISSNTPLKIRGMTTEEAVLRPQFWKGFQKFQDYSLKLVQLNIERKRLADINRVKEKELLDELAVDISLRHISTALEAHAPPVLSMVEDKLLRACQLVGHEIGVHFTALKEKKMNMTMHQLILELCERAGARSRKVVLDKGFWKHDSLPLLGFYKDTHHPVAIINHEGSKYVLVDPMTLKREPLNEANENLLSTEAYTFYEPFPQKKLSGIDIIKFIIKGKRKEGITIAVVGVLGGLLSLLPPYFIKILFNNVIGDGLRPLLWQIIVGLVLVTISTAIFMLTRSFTMLRLTQLIDYKLESALWDRILNLPTKFFRQFTVGNLIERVYSVSQIHQLVSGTTVKVILSGIFSLFYFFAMLMYSPLLAVIGLSIILSSVIVSSICIFFKVSLQRKILALSGIINGIVVQIIAGVGKLRTSGAENRAFAHWSGHYTEYKRLTRKSQSIQNIVTTVSAILPVFSSAVLFTIVMFSFQGSVEAGLPAAITIGSLIAFFAAYVPFSQAIFDVSNTLINIVQVIPLWERSKVILREEPEMSVDKTKIDHLSGDMLIDHVSFRYEENSPLVLDNVTLYANQGEYIGIVGPSGSGKSTLMRIMLGFEIPENGSVYYNGKDLSSLDLRKIRHQIGSVLQNGSIFSGPLYDNIVCGGTYTKEEVEYALKLSGFEEDLKNLPMGLHTVVQSGGGTFSGGQLQRLLIARALISKPKILIFDEATSALDNHTQELISNNLDELKVTRIVIAHRLTTIRNADRIYVLEHGQVIQTGTFQELASQEGLFKQMLNRQKL